MPKQFELPPATIELPMSSDNIDRLRLRGIRTRRGLKLHEDGKYYSISFDDDGTFHRFSKGMIKTDTGKWIRQ